MDQRTTKEAVDKLADIFRKNNRNDLVNEKFGKQDLKIQPQLRGYKKKDPETNQETYFTPLFLRQLFHRAINGMQLSIANLAILGFFFTIRY